MYLNNKARDQFESEKCDPKKRNMTFCDEYGTLKRKYNGEPCSKTCRLWLKENLSLDKKLYK